MSDTKTRARNFTPSEEIHLLRLVASKYSAVIENKKTDRASGEKKEKAWLEIASEFNATSSSSVFRLAARLKKCYENRKKELWKSLAEEKKQVSLTGGGPAPKKMKTDEADGVLLSIVNSKTVMGMQNCFDDDGDKTPIYLDPVENDDFEFITKDENQEQSHQIDPLVETASLSSTPGPSLVSTGWRKYTANQLQEPVNPVLNSTIKNISDGSNISNEKMPKSIPTCRRRPTMIINPLTSSDVAKNTTYYLKKE